MPAISPVAPASVTAGTGSLIAFRHARLTNEAGNAGNRLSLLRRRGPGAAWAKRSVPGTKRHRRPRPSPHTPFTTSALSIPTDAAPPPNGSPFIGKIMNHEVSVGGKAPNSAAGTQKRQSFGARGRSQAIQIDQAPPQNVSETMTGAPNGYAGRV